MARQQELREANSIDLACELPPRLPQGRRGALDQIRRPLEIVCTVVPELQCSEQSIVFQPVRALVAEPLVGGPKIFSCSPDELAPRGFEQSMLERDDDVIVDSRRREDLTRAVARSQQSVLDQEVRADQQSVPREGGQRLIRRVAVARWAERQCLPPALPCLVKPVDPRERCRSQIADAVRRRQRRDVQQDPRGTIVRRERGNADRNSGGFHAAIPPEPRRLKPDATAAAENLAAGRPRRVPPGVAHTRRDARLPPGAIRRRGPGRAERRKRAD